MGSLKPPGFRKVDDAVPRWEGRCMEAHEEVYTACNDALRVM